MSKKKKIFVTTAVCFATLLLIVGGCYISVDFNAAGRTFDDIEDVPEYEYGLLLGTTPLTAEKKPNEDFNNRIAAAVELYKAGKIKKIIASGGDFRMDDNGKYLSDGYNEIEAMQDALSRYGVPREDVIRDYDGRRTLKSIVKAKDIYKVDSCVIISQKFHNERAIKIADHYGIKAIGYNATPSDSRSRRIKNQARELLARVRLYLDLWFGKPPRFTSYLTKVAPGKIEEWYDEPDTIPGIPGAIAHRSLSDADYNYYKYFSTKDGLPLYYNERHGYYLLLPKGIGYIQSGESVLGGHFNEFYNSDTTLVVTANASFYDTVLYDCPEYPDSMKIREKEYMMKLGKTKPKEVTPDIFISEGWIDHSDPDNPPADRFLRKWLLKKDIEGRECDMVVTIYFNDSLSYRLPEFREILSQFPTLPTFPKR